MGSTFGNKIKTSIFGQSHSEAIGVTIDGLPAGFEIDIEKLESFMARRAPGQSKYSTPRKEADKPEFLCGLVGNRTCGAPITAVIRNTNVRSKDYEAMRDVPRPGHADFTGHVKFGGFEDGRGGGHFSGRLTAPLCVAGGIYLQMLEDKGIEISTEIVEIGGNCEKPFEEIERAMEEGDSVGGIVKCTISGVPAGLGDPMFFGLENVISQAVFGIPAIKGIEFGAGFEATRMRGSENNDSFFMAADGSVMTRTNNSGGILGGISNGCDIVFDVAIKPTPSIAKEQASISYSKKEDAVLAVRGRHDPCIVPRVLPCIEAAAAMALMEFVD